MSDKTFESIKYVPKENSKFYRKGWQSVTREQVKQAIAGFCKRDDLNFAEQTKFLAMFEDYCEKNGFPIPNRKLVGSVLREVFGASSTTVRIDGVVKRIYICSTEEFDIDALGIRRKS